MLGAGDLQRVRPIAGHQDPVPLAGQSRPNRLGDGRLVLHDQDRPFVHAGNRSPRATAAFSEHVENLCRGSA